MHQRSNSKSRFLRRLKREAAAMKNFEDRTVTEHMIVVMVASEVGTDVDDLVERTGYKKDFIENISIRMRKAGLWNGQQVDDREWCDPNLLSLRGIFSHALVAQGSVTRVPNEHGGYTYLDAETGEVSGEWNPTGTGIK